MKSRIIIFEKIRTLKSLFGGLITILFLILMIVFPQSYVSGAHKGMGYCFNILVPSLFPFMFISSFIVRLEITEKFAETLSKTLEFLFCLPGAAASVIILSFFGGYPVGAKMSAVLLKDKKLTPEDANRLMLFSINAGPAFIISVVGITLIGNYSVGIIILISQIFSSIILGVISSLKLRFNSKKNKRTKISHEHKHGTLADNIIESCADAATSVITMCALVIIFSVITFLLNDCGVFEILSGALSYINISPKVSETFMLSALEVTAGCSCAAKSSLRPEVFSFIVGWGGICTHLQVFSALKNVSFNYKMFMMFRFLHGAISFLLTFAGVRLFPTLIPAFFSSGIKPMCQNSSTFYGSIALIMLCIYFTTNLALKFKTQNSNLRHRAHCFWSKISLP